jgi:type II secretory pathway component PulF
VAVNRARYSAAWDRSLGWLPFIGKMRACWAAARFSRVGHAGLLAGLNPHHWVRLASSASGSGRFHEGGLQAAETIGTGEAIALSLRRSGGFPAPLVDRLDTAEQIVELDHELQRLAEEKTEDARQATRRAAEWLPKIAYALVALIVAWQIVKTFMAIYQPVFDLL